MFSFVNDYCEGAYPAILEMLKRINFEKQAGYGFDRYSASARDKIRKACSCPEAEIFFLTGGTQTNLIAIDCLSEPYEGVIAADTGHVNTHEAGAIEYTGHKVITIPGMAGKLDAKALAAYLESFFADDSYEHMVIPGIVYISQPTELGTLYTAEELKALYELCGEYELPLYLDGARLGTALAACSNTGLSDVAKYCDAFYIGGTKCGALFGEALVFTKNNKPKHFMTRVKQHGALLAKGWLVGAQYDVLFEDDLYIKLGQNAVKQASKLKLALTEKGYEFYADSPTNQLFVLVDDEQAGRLAETIAFTVWEKPDEAHTVIRFCTSWATTDEDIAGLIAALPDNAKRKS